MSEPISLKEEPKKPLYVLTSKSGGHAYHITASRKSKGVELWTGHGFNADGTVNDVLGDVERPKDKWLDLCILDWRFDQEFYDTCLSLHTQIATLGLNDYTRTLYEQLDYAMDVMDEAKEGVG